MSATYRLRLLGPVEVERDGVVVRHFVSRKAVAMLGYLAVRNQPVSRIHLADLFWQDKTENRGRGNLSRVVSNFSDLLPGCLQADYHAVQFQPTATYWLDVRAFEDLIAKNDITALTAAMELYRGSFMADISLDDCPEFETWLVTEREQWQQRIAQILQEVTDYYTHRGEYKQGLHFASRLINIEPWNEEAHQRMMRLLSRTGQYTAALTQYETCRRVLAEELDIEPLPETVALYERIRAARNRPNRHNLPAQPNPCVGRTIELAQIHQALASPATRLLTIIGPGGIGKTRLALEAAAAQVNVFLDGVVFIPLAGLDEIKSLVLAIAAGLNFSFSDREDPKTQLLKYLRQKEILLVLDSLEHLLDEVNFLVSTLEMAPEVKLLVTSRQRLNLYWEFTLPLEGLDYPARGAIEQLETYGAVQMFLQSSRRIQPGFSLSNANRADVAAICQLVEGMPLAIDLAATWVRVLSCTNIADEIADGLDILATSQPDIPVRHRSLRAVFEHAWCLLTPPEQQVFSKLSVFRGPFQRKAAREVADASLPILTSLVDKSLLRFMSSGYYEIHELLREYAAERLAATVLTHLATQEKHCTYYTKFLQYQEVDFNGKNEQKTAAKIEAEIDNIHAAWYWAVSQAKLDEIDRSVNPLSYYYLIRGSYQKGETILGMAIDRLQVLLSKMDNSERGALIVFCKLLVKQAQLLNMQRLPDRVIPIVQEIIDLAHDNLVVDLEAEGFLQRGWALFQQGNYKVAEVQLERALVLAQTAQLGQVESNSVFRLGYIFVQVGDYAKANTHFEQALRLAEKLDDRRLQIQILRGLGVVSWTLGNFVKATAYFEQTLRFSREIGDRWVEANVLVNLGSACSDQGDYTEGKIYLEQALSICREMGEQQLEGRVLNELGLTYRYLGNYVQAKAYFEQALLIHRSLNNRYSMAVTLATKI